MAVSTKRSLAALGLVIATAGSLNQCAKDLGRTLAEQHAPRPPNVQEGFGPVRVRELGLRDDGGREVEAEVVSTRPRSWGQAGVLLADRVACGEGRSHIVLDSHPRIEAPASSGDLPAGTRFTQRIACEGRLPNEIPWTEAMDHTDAWQAAHRHLWPRMKALGAGEYPQVAIQPVLYSDRFGQKKYEAFNAALGGMVRRRSGECGGPVVLVDAVTVVKSASIAMPGTESPMYETLILGTHIDCATAAP